MLVMHRIASFKMDPQRYCCWHSKTWFGRGLSGQNELFRGVNGNVATRGLASAPYVTRDVELRAPMFGMAIHARHSFLFMNWDRFLFRMTALTTGVFHMSETGVAGLAPESRVGFCQGTRAIR